MWPPDSLWHHWLWCECLEPPDLLDLNETEKEVNTEFHSLSNPQSDEAKGDVGGGGPLDEFLICNPFCLLFSHSLFFLSDFVFLLTLYPLFLLFQKVSELIMRCFNLSCITCNQAGGFCAKTTSSVDLVKLPALPSKSKDSYMISNCLWSSSVRVSSNFNIFTWFVMGVIDSSSSLSLLCSLLGERKLPIGNSNLFDNWLSCLNIETSL